MMTLNFWVGWLAIFAGLLVGTTLGLFFHRENWLGGYNAWPRRMLRLGHISLVGTGLLNLAFAVSCEMLGLDSGLPAASALFLVGAVSMPSVCLLAAWRRPMRHLFFIPVGSLLLASADFIYQGLLR